MMIPNKKTLDTKNQSPWILCPSKRFPGKFYYFNTSTADTVWSVSDKDTNFRKDTIHKVTDNSHSYPEPIGPPNDESTTTTNSFSSLTNGNTKFGNNVTNFGNYVTKEANPHRHMSSPSFFPKYVMPEAFPPNVIWTLTPMYVPSPPLQPHKQMFDQMGQAYERDQPIFMPTPSMPSNNQYQTMNSTLHYPNGFQFTQNHSTSLPPFGKEVPTFGQASFNAFKPKEMFTLRSKSKTKDEACQTFMPISPTRPRTQSESDPTLKSTLKPSRSVENKTSLLKKDVGIPTRSPPHKVDIENDKKLSELVKNDLRFLLVAKRKKDMGETSKSMDDQSKPIKTQEVMTTKKRVTFELYEDTSPDGTIEFSESPSSPQEYPRQPDPPSGREWYVVADMDALLTDFQCIEQYVQRDSSCRLLIPAAVRSAVTARGRGDGGALAARQLLRRLVATPDYILLQSDTEYVQASLEENILQCCWDLLQENIRVVLITNNPKMTSQASNFDLECQTIEKIQNYYHPLALPQFDMKKLNLFGNNDKKKSQNLFMQDVSEIKRFGFTKTNGFSVQGSRTNLFNIESYADDGFSEKDKNTDKFINLTKSKANTVINSEMTNVKEQVTKLSIAGNSNIQNGTKMIMKNVFRNTGHDNKIDPQATIFETKVKENYKLTVNDNDYKNQDLDSIPTDSDIGGLDKQIKRLNFTECNAEKNRDTFKVSGVTKLNITFKLDEELQRYYIKNAVMENRVKSRLDEWICRFRQIMEGVLTDVLIKEKVEEKGVGMFSPWCLYEAVQITGKTFNKQEHIKMIVDRFSMKLLECSTEKGKLKKNMKPNELFKLFCFSKVLLQKLKEIVHYEELYEADDMLNDLLRDIEDPKIDIDLTLEKFNTPVFSRSEIIEPKVESFRKSQTEIINYLKNHFEEWNKSGDPTVVKVVNDINTRDNKPNILRTCGKNLSMFKIDKTKAITIDNKESRVNKETDEFKATNKPKVIRNVKIIEAYEEKMKKKELDLDELDCDEREYEVSSYDSYDDGTNETEVTKGSEEDLKTNDLPDFNSLLEDLSLSSSSTDTECVRAYPIVRIFLVRLKGTFLGIFNFINKIMREFQEEMPLHRKEDIRLKFEIVQQHLLRFIKRMNNIIARQGDGSTLKNLLIKAGDYVEDDKIIANYKEIVTEYLEQAHTLQDAVTIILPLCKGSTKDRDTGYSDTFQTSSPILPTRALRGNKVVQSTNVN